MTTKNRWTQSIIADKEKRDKDDLYVTPPIGTKALLAVEEFRGLIAEPACGMGHISKVLVEKGFDVNASDLNYHGHGQGGVDFLKPYPFPRPHGIITNPPFKKRMPELFAKRSIDLALEKVALLCRLTWLEGERRYEHLFTHQPPTRIWVFPYRINVYRSGDETYNKRGNGLGGMVAFAWYVWLVGQPTHRGKPEIGWLPGPNGLD